MNLLRRSWARLLTGTAPPTADDVRDMARHLPPSGSALRLLLFSADPRAAEAWLRVRPDLQLVRLASIGSRLPVSVGDPIVRVDVQCLPFARSNADAIAVPDGLNRLPGAFLAEALRVLRPGGRLIVRDRPRRAFGQPTPDGAARPLDAAGFARVFGERLANGGVLSRGEKPYPALPETPSPTAADGLTPITAGQAVQRSRGRPLFLLIRQTPDKPIWALTPDDALTWGAASVLDRGTPVALVFTALPKAVAWMQPAVRDYGISGITKVAKFEAGAAARWDFPVLLDPPLEPLRDTARFTLLGPWLGVAPTSAVRGEE